MTVQVILMMNPPYVFSQFNLVLHLNSDHHNQGIGGAGGRLHAVQERLAEGHGSQCGFCTPGIGDHTVSNYSQIIQHNFEYH